MGRLVILKCGETSASTRAAHGDYEAWFERAIARVAPGAVTLVHDLRRADAAIPEAAGYVLTGARESVNDPLDWLPAARRNLGRLIDRGAWILGVCFGHQLLAVRGGGRVRPNPLGWEVGTVEVRLTAAGSRDPLLGRLGACFAAQQAHRDVVVELPGGAEVLASSPKDRHHALRLGARVWSVQFHPEVDRAIGAASLEARRPTLVEEDLRRGDPPGTFADRVAAGLRETAAGDLLLARFVELALGGVS